METRQIKRLKEIGAWPKVDGRAVYGTQSGPYECTYVDWRKSKPVQANGTIQIHKPQSEKGGLPYVVALETDKGMEFIPVIENKKQDKKNETNNKTPGSSIVFYCLGLANKCAAFIRS